MNLNKNNLQELFDKIRSLEKSESFLNWKEVRKSRIILYPHRYNYLSLSRELKLYRHTHTDIIHFWGESNQRRNFQRRITRCFLNYLSTANAIIDITRVSVRRLEFENEIKASYEELLQIQQTKPLSSFVKNLRNYALHYAVLDVNVFFSSTHCDDGLHQEGYPYLSLSEIQNWSRWSPEARTFFKELRSDKIDLGATLEQYHAQFMKMQDHIWSLTLRHRRKPLIDLITVMEELSELKTDYQLDLALPLQSHESRYLKWILNKNLIFHDSRLDNIT